MGFLQCKLFDKILMGKGEDFLIKFFSFIDFLPKKIQIIIIKLSFDFNEKQITALIFSSPDTNILNLLKLITPHVIFKEDLLIDFIIFYKIFLSEQNDEIHNYFEILYNNNAKVFLEASKILENPLYIELKSFIKEKKLKNNVVSFN